MLLPGAFPLLVILVRGVLLLNVFLSKGSLLIATAPPGSAGPLDFMPATGLLLAAKGMMGLGAPRS